MPSSCIFSSDIHNNESVYVIQSAKRGHDDTSSESSIFQPESKRKKTLNFFLGKGQKEWSPKTERVINNLNITQALLKFRSRNINVAETSSNLSPVRILSLSHVFLIDKYSISRCLSSYLSDDIVAALRETVNESIHIKKVSRNSTLYAKELLDCHNDGNSFDSVQFSPSNDQEKLLQKLCKRLWRSSASIHKRSETSFMTKHFMPFTHTLLLDDTGNDVVYSL
ncbi:hypothetical protein MBANPS3_011957 [Mucor bainieri]